MFSVRLSYPRKRGLLQPAQPKDWRYESIKLSYPRKRGLLQRLFRSVFERENVVISSQKRTSTTHYMDFSELVKSCHILAKEDFYNKDNTFIRGYVLIVVISSQKRTSTTRSAERLALRKHKVVISSQKRTSTTQPRQKIPQRLAMLLYPRKRGLLQLQRGQKRPKKMLLYPRKRGLLQPQQLTRSERIKWLLYPRKRGLLQLPTIGLKSKHHKVVISSQKRTSTTY